MQHAQIVGGLGSMPCTQISMALSLAPNLSACQALFSFIFLSFSVHNLIPQKCQNICL